MNNLKNAFDNIKANEELKANTIIFLQNEIKKRGKTKKHIVFKRLAVTFTFAAIIFLSGIFSYNLYFTPAAYIDMDVNPSIELTVNRFNRVIEVKPYNNAGSVILNDVHVRHKIYNEAVQDLLDEMMNRGYLTVDGLVSMTVQTENSTKEKILLDGLEIMVVICLDSHHSTAETNFFAVSQEVRHNAAGNNVSPARYIAVTELKEVDPTATFEGCANRSLREIRQNTHQHRNNHNNHNNHHGVQPTENNHVNDNCDRHN